MLNYFDKYSIKARVAPFIILISPIFFGIIVWIPATISFQFGSISIVVVISVSVLMSQISRDAGKSKEKSLWNNWGGPPTTRFLRHSNEEFNPILKKKCHDKMKKILKDIKYPTNQDEKRNPSNADLVYEAFTKILISKTRDSKKFPLILQENINYGFIRNLWGLKSIGITFSVLSSLSSLINIIICIKKTSFDDLPKGIICSIVSIIFLIIWIFWIQEKRIKLIANSYAERLFETCNE